MDERLISINAAIKTAHLPVIDDAGYEVVRMDDILALPTVDAVPVVRCKDCKHRPTGINRDDLEFPDDKCPCKCEDYWYSWKPSDNWFCGNGERKDDGD